MVAVALSPLSDAGQCLTASSASPSPLGGEVCQGACVFLAPCGGAAPTLWNVSLAKTTLSADLQLPEAPRSLQAQPGAFWITVASHPAAPELLGYFLSVSGSVYKMQLWPPNTICCAGDQWVQAKGGALFVARDNGLNACMANISTCCPTAVAGAECSGHGACSPSGQCTCSGPCWSGADCATFDAGACGAGGSCAVDTGVCLCNDACHSGARCEVVSTCSGLGTCDPAQCGCNCYDSICHISTGSDCVPKNCGVGESFCEKGMCICEAQGCTDFDVATQTCVAIKVSPLPFRCALKSSCSRPCTSTCTLRARVYGRATCLNRPRARALSPGLWPARLVLRWRLRVRVCMLVRAQL